MSAYSALRPKSAPTLSNPSKDERPFALTRIDEARVNIRTEGDLVDAIIADARAGIGGTVFTLNLDHLVKLAENAAFRAAYQRATYITADGVPVVLLARGKGTDVDRVTGADLVEPLCRAAAAAGIGVFLFGSREAVLDKAADVLLKKAPGLSIAGTLSPPMGFDPFGADAGAAAAAIGRSGARICFVALGAPKQELFANAAMTRTSGVIYVCIGAALDFHAGAQARAPKLLSDYGFEWLWRLVHDPRRLARRYLRSGLYLIRYLGGGVLRRARRTVATFIRELTRDVGDRNGPSA